jgi:uncharacterized protein
MSADRNLPPRAATVRETAYDAGLRDFFRGIYNNMAVGLGITGAAAWLVASSPALMHLFFANQIVAFAVIFSPLLILWFGLTPRRIATMSAGQVAGVFFGLSALIGISFATIFLIYSHESIARAFFITAGTFAGMSIMGYTTKRNLAGLGSFAIMGMMGALLASIVNIFMHSSGIQFGISVVVIIASIGLIAWNTQMFKEMYGSAGSREETKKLAVMGALSLYLSFINLFQALLSLMGDRR